MRKFRKTLLFTVLLLIVFVLPLLLFPSNTVFAEAVDAEFVDEPLYFFRGEVLSVENVPSTHPFATLDQESEVLLTGGPFRGQSVSIVSTFIEGDPHLNIYLEKGMEIILAASVIDGEIIEAHLHDVARDRGLYYLLAIFVVMLLLIGRLQGLKTIITLVFTGVVILKVLLPLLLAGHEPIPVAILSAIAIVVVTFLILTGISAKSISAIVGTVCGVSVAGILALWVGEISHLTGFSSEEAQMLYFMEQTINIRGLLFAGIIIGSLGAVTDMGMSIASAAAEIKSVNPGIRPYQLTRAALNVGRDTMGTMSNTLILAYTGGAMPLLLLFLGYDMDWLKIVNLDLIATEVVKGIAGSIGLFASVPVTALVSGFLMGNKSN